MEQNSGAEWHTISSWLGRQFPFGSLRRAQPSHGGCPMGSRRPKVDEDVEISRGDTSVAGIGLPTEQWCVV